MNNLYYMNDSKRILFYQFLKSISYKELYTYSEDLMKEFNNWLSQLRKEGKEYLKLLGEEGIDLDSLSVEFGKTKYDSLAFPLNRGYISPYINGLKMEVTNDKPILYIANDRCNFACELFDILYTQNPYSECDIKNWEQIHNNGKTKLLVGVYGKTYDKDLKQKIKMMEDFKDKLYCDCYGLYFNEDYVEIDDNYFYFINTKHKTLVKTLTR